LQKCPWPEPGKEEAAAGRIPAASVAGGEVPRVESQEERGSYLGMCSDGVGEAGRRLAGVG